MTRLLRVANVSGCYGGRFQAVPEMLAGGEIDVLTGDYLAELTMFVLGRDRMRDPAAGYAKTFLRQLEATGGNHAFFTEHDTAHPGIPIAEVAADGSSVISTYPGTSGAVIVSTVAAQLGCEIAGPRYPGPDVTARFDTIELNPAGLDRVAISGVRGEASQARLKVCLDTLHGYRDSATFVLCGLGIEEKAGLAPSPAPSGDRGPHRRESRAAGPACAELRDPRRARRECRCVDGAKTFVTSGTRADFVTTAVRTGGPGVHGVSLLGVEKGTPGFEVTGKLEKVGRSCSDTAELAFAGARVPVANPVGEENGGFAAIARSFAVERLALAVQAYAGAQRALDLTLGWCRRRETFGRPLVSRQTVRHTLAEMARNVGVARTYARDVALCHAAGEDVSAAVCFAKGTAVAAGEWVVDKAAQLHGGMGYMHGSEVERQYRDMRILGIGGGTTEIMTDLAARTLGYTT